MKIHFIEHFTDKGKESGMMEKLRWMLSVYPHNEAAAPDLSYSNTIFAHSLCFGYVCVLLSLRHSSLSVHSGGAN